MKYFQILFITLLTSACTGAKPVTESNSTKITEHSQTTKDSIIIVKEFIETDSVNDITFKENEPNINFHQILAKRVTVLHELWNNLLQKHVSNNGNVNYKSFKTEHKKLLDYIYVLNLELSSEGFQSFSKEEKLAFWINAYNAMTIDLILRNYPVKSIKDIKNPWEQRLWKLGKKWYNLNDIEHQILRKMNEPRIHFAIVCASVSCPKLLNEAYTFENLETQLTKASKQFLSDSERNSILENDLKLSKIFQWFSKDFKQNGSLIDFLNKYSEVKISNNAKISFKDYNWDLNE
ncbi:DUF547 domain-containing protein [Mariniflexile jejuense]|uniref:DUF547 domain-containing protein n=1 Tax=Mariniflexile jejuense TaxID=1173582 RepID=A0ABW3JHN6_9FLAO